jgi:predicted acyl esterase
MRRMVHRFVMVVWLCAFASCAIAQPPARTYRVAMRDGIRLATDVYLPVLGEGPWPTLLVRTPYNKDLYRNEYGSWASKGYAVVIQDMRGRFASEGTDLAFLDGGWNERQDGVDTLAWIAGQGWCDGKIGTLGASAMGITQNMLAGAAPKELTAQYLLVAAGNLYEHAAYTGGALRLALTATWLMGNRFDPANLWFTVLHPMYDSHWARVDGIAQAEHVNVPGVHFGGWYDCFVQGTIDTFVARQECGAPGARGTQKLIVGPWCHGGPGSVEKPKKAGKFLFPENARSLPQAIGAEEWFDHYLKGEGPDVEAMAPVMYYTMGALDEPGAPGNMWRVERAWPPESESVAMFFQPDGTLAMEPPAERDASMTFTYDPRDPVPSLGGANLCIPCGAFDQRAIEAREDVLVFTSAPLDAPLEVTGRVTAALYVESDCPDTDFTAKLCDVYPDGRSMNICDGLMRMRHRNGFDRIDLLEPGEVVPVDVDLWSTSLVFNQGHRIRVEISSSNYPRFDVNPNTGWPAWPFCPVRVARNTVHCSGTHASFIELPVVRRAR